VSKRSTSSAWLRARDRAPLAAVWAAGAVLTAVGMFFVARACGLPWYLAWLYSLAADGLGLVAFRAAVRLRGFARAYAVLIVMACTGLSAAVQAVHLRLGSGLDGAATPGLRTAVGAAPAVAVALAAHLHWLTTRPTKLAVSLSSIRPEDTQQDTVTGAVPDGATGPGGMAPTSPPGPGPDSGEAGAPAGLSGQTAPAGAPGSAPDTAPAGAPDTHSGETAGAPGGLHLVSAPSAPETAPVGAPTTAPARRRERAASAPGVHRVTARATAPVRTDEQLAAAAATALAADPSLSRRRLARQLGTSQDRLRDVLGPAGGGS
jgi:hypothetical protein